MKNVLMFPINIFIYAGKGVKYTFNFLLGKNKKSSNKLQGQALTEELKKVQQQSNDFKRQNVEIQEQKKNDNLKLIQFKYVAKTSDGNVIKGIFDAETKDDVRIFLVNGGYDVVSIEPTKFYESSLSFGTDKIGNNALAFMLTQLATYIKAGIPLIDSVRILSKQATKTSQRRVYDKVVYELVMGEKFSSALEKQKGAFPKLLINMIKTAEMTGDLSGTLDEMSEYYTEIEKTRKQMVSALIYPSVIFSLAIAAIVFIVIFVVPQFTAMFEGNGAKIPGITLFIISASSFLKNYWYVIATVLVAILVTYKLAFTYIKAFRKGMQTIFMRLPVIGKIIIYNEVTNFTRTFSSLLYHNVFITDSMEILSNISTNEVYKEIINRTLIGLSKGNRISDAFKGEWAFPIIAYEMLVTGENTGQLAVMMQKVADHYQSLHKNAVTTIKSLIEPIIICFLAFAVGFIVLSIVIPMFEMYQTIM